MLANSLIKEGAEFLPQTAAASRPIILRDPALGP
jgi:hypothetical protein